MPRARRRLGAGAPSLSEKEYGARSTSPWPRAARPCFHIPARAPTAESRVGNAPASTRYHTALPRPRSSRATGVTNGVTPSRSEEHTSELQSQSNLVCRLLLEKKKKKNKNRTRLE